MYQQWQHVVSPRGNCPWISMCGSSCNAANTIQSLLELRTAMGAIFMILLFWKKGNFRKVHQHAAKVTNDQVITFHDMP
jgi:hypothetical protein